MTVATTRSRSSILALCVAGFAILLIATMVAFIVLNDSFTHGVDAGNPVELTLGLTFAVVGGLIASRLPRNPIGWVFLAMAVVEALAGVAGQYSLLGLVTHPHSVPAVTWVLWLYGWISALVYPTGLAAVAFLLMPDGRLPSRRWRPLLVVTIVWTALVVPLNALSPGNLTTGISALPALSNPAGQRALDAFNSNATWGGQSIVYLVGLALFLACAGALLMRLRGARGDERQQVKWIAYTIVTATVLNVASVIAYLALPSAFQSPIFWLVPIGIGFGVALPVSVGIAIFKYRLYDIDIVISRTIVYTLLAVFITIVYVGIAVGIGTLVGSGGKPNLGLSILATAIVALGFQPVRERLQRVANRLVYGERATPYEALSQFSQRAADSYSLAEVLPRMARVLGEGTGAERADVWLRSGEVLLAAASWPDDAEHLDAVSQLNGISSPALLDATRVCEVSHHGEALGALSVQKRRGESLTPVEDKLIEDLARQAGLVLKNVRLTAELQQKLEELRVSRQRLVVAQDEERRRLERNLHDGAQQHLVAIKMKLGLAEMMLAKDPEKAMDTISQLKHDTDDALQTLRDLARGIYPPLLADKGLRSALESQATKATVPVAVCADGVGRYPPDVEATVYFCVLEALQNIQKYASATQVQIELEGDDHVLRFAVTDDGRGFDVATAERGDGLANMRDRIDALGGSLHIASSPGAGARIAGELPIAVTALTAS